MTANSSSGLRVLVTGASGVTSRSIARALRESGRFPDLLLIGTEGGENAFSLSEGLFDEIYSIPQANSEDYWPAIGALQEQYAFDAALVIPEKEVLLWGTGNPYSIKVALPSEQFGRVAGDKGRLYEVLAGSSCVPPAKLMSREELLTPSSNIDVPWPVWVRPHHFGVSSGAGALKAQDETQLRAWAELHPAVASWQVAAFVEGRNTAVCLLFDQGEMQRVGLYERDEYFMSGLVPSGVTGNISQGHLTYERQVVDEVLAAIRKIEEVSGEVAHGLITVDLIDTQSGIAITEVNLRATACVGLFTQAGYDISGDWLELALGRLGGVPSHGVFPEGNQILRDIDGIPQWHATAPTFRPIDKERSTLD